MMFRRLTLAAALTVLPAIAHAQATVMVADPTFQPDTDPIAGNAATLLELFSTKLDDATECRVTSKDDLRVILKMESLRQVLGGGQPAPGMVEELAGALGSDTLVVWSIGRLGNTYVVNGRALRAMRAVAGAAATATTTTTTGVIEAVSAVATKLGQALKCPKPGVDYLIYEVSLTSDNDDVTEIRTITSRRRFRRTDTIEIPPGLFASPSGSVDLEQNEHWTIVSKPGISQCPGPDGYRNLPSKSDSSTDGIATAQGPTEPGVEISYEGGEIKIAGQVDDENRPIWNETQRTTGIACGEPTEPTEVTNTSDSRSVAINNASFDLRVPLDGSKTIQSGTRSWPMELNEWKGTMTLTWRLSGRR